MTQYDQDHTPDNGMWKTELGLHFLRKRMVELNPALKALLHGPEERWLYIEDTGQLIHAFSDYGPCVFLETWRIEENLVVSVNLNVGAADILLAQQHLEDKSVPLSEYLGEHPAMGEGDDDFWRRNFPIPEVQS